jgi:hypothetical protein
MSNPTDTHTPAPSLPWALQNFVSMVFPQGGQAQARRNAWLAMCNNQVRAWERAEAQRFLEPLARRQSAATPQEPPQPQALAL